MTPDLDSASPNITIHEDESGRQFGYVHIRHPGSVGLAIHFSAFYNRRGLTRSDRVDFGGYFHRLKMLGSHSGCDWLFLCDSYGAFANGCYYLGSQGDLFVERAVETIIDRVLVEHGYSASQTVTVGSSMGGTGALKFGRRMGVAGIVAIGPHIDLDISAVQQNRVDEVRWALPDGDVESVTNHVLTRQIRRELAEIARPLPRLFIQSCQDDHGVHHEQVLPLAREWREHGGDVLIDERESGGHTSSFATRALLVHVIERLIAGEPIDDEQLKTDERFAGSLPNPSRIRRLRRRLALRSRVRRIRSRLGRSHP